MQFGNDFLPNLSIVDVMMFNSAEEIGTLLNEYALISGRQFEGSAGERI